MFIDEHGLMNYYIIHDANTGFPHAWFVCYKASTDACAPVRITGTLSLNILT